MERRLLEAAQKGNITELNDLIRSNGLHPRGHGSQRSRSHAAARRLRGWPFGFRLGAPEVDPKFGEKVDADGFSPLHIAAARGDVEIARELLRVGRHLCSVTGRERRIPLHYAVVNGELHVVKLMLSAWPESIEETTAQEETALHLTVKKNWFDAVVVLVEHLKQNNKEQVINWKDHEGNTVLHLATSIKDFEVVKFMLCGDGLEYEAVEVNALNESGLIPLDVLTVSQRGAGDRGIREILAQAGARHGRGRSNSPASRLVLADEDSILGDNSHQSDGEPVPNTPYSIVCTQSKKLKEGKDSVAGICNALPVVAALIASATYQAVLQPPSYKIKVGGNHKKGIFGYNDIYRASGYILFMSSNPFGFLVSVQTIICPPRDLPVRLPLLLSTYSMVLTYVAFMANVLFTSMDKALSVKNMALFSLLPLTIPILLLLTQRRLARFLHLGLKSLSQWNIVGDMYNLRANPDSQSIGRWDSDYRKHSPSIEEN